MAPTSAPSARVDRRSERWTRPWSAARVSSSTRGSAQWPKPATSSFPCGKTPSISPTSSGSSERYSAVAWPGARHASRDYRLQVAGDGRRRRRRRASRVRPRGRTRPGSRIRSVVWKSTSGCWSIWGASCATPPSAWSSDPRSSSWLRPTAFDGGVGPSVPARRRPACRARGRSTRPSPARRRRRPACATSAASRTRVSAISRSIPPRAQLINSAD